VIDGMGHLDFLGERYPMVMAVLMSHKELSRTEGVMLVNQQQHVVLDDCRGIGYSSLTPCSPRHPSRISL
jgi:hypothetical protein